MRSIAIMQSSEMWGLNISSDVSPPSRSLLNIDVRYVSMEKCTNSATRPAQRAHACSTCRVFASIRITVAPTQNLSQELVTLSYISIEGVGICGLQDKRKKRG